MAPTILLVEDDADVRQVFQNILRMHGLTVLAAESGPDALEIWTRARSQILILLTDIVMPGELTGWELAERLQREKPELRVIFTSGYPREFASFAGSKPANAIFLQKPYGAEALLAAVQNALIPPRIARTG